jgi:hypothetical protein
MYSILEKGVAPRGDRKSDRPKCARAIGRLGSEAIVPHSWADRCMPSTNEGERKKKRKVKDEGEGVK